MPVITTNQPGGITLIRRYVNHPDEVGGVGAAQTHIDQLYRQNAFPAFWSGLRLELCHMSDLWLRDTANQPNLLDYDTRTPGCQVAAGLYLGGKRLQIGVFPDRWNPDGTGSTAVSDANRAAALSVISHEIGHMHADLSGFTSARDAVTGEITRLFRILRPNQAGNEHEDWAEVYRAVMGADAVRGTFSDGKHASLKPGLDELMRASYWLAVALQGKVIHGLSAWPGYVQWIERAWWWDTHYRLGLSSWHLEKWTGSNWVKA